MSPAMSFVFKRPALAEQTNRMGAETPLKPDFRIISADCDVITPPVQAAHGVRALQDEAMWGDKLETVSATDQ
ncbi:hypothetical protein RRG08_053602 [Elysia crispata]|uniref:Uncharacterized protein n=1 Tax=Elysia crispata TaxID=231223 RepID=A0AAE0Y2B4_9GAST|nr:hypothetical protein RRG08_053602 [Elysia crispata]